MQDLSYLNSLFSQTTLPVWLADSLQNSMSHMRDAMWFADGRWRQWVSDVSCVLLYCMCVCLSLCCFCAFGYHLCDRGVCMCVCFYTPCVLCKYAYQFICRIVCVLCRAFFY